MLENIKENVKTYNWRNQSVSDGENKESISNIIDRIERGHYKTKEVDYNIENYNLSAEEFDCNDLFQFLTHYKLVENSDLDYPIIIQQDGQVIDGRHRICKAILQGKKKIKGIVILDSNII